MILVVLLHEFTMKFHVKHILYTGFYFLPVLLLTFYAKLFCPGLSLSRHGCFFCYITLKRKKMPSQPTDNWSKKSKNKKVQYFLVYSSYFVILIQIKKLLSLTLQEALVNAGDMGRDYEHCLELQKKANDLESAVSRSLGHVLHHSFTDQFISLFLRWWFCLIYGYLLILIVSG